MAHSLTLGEFKGNGTGILISSIEKQAPDIVRNLKCEIAINPILTEKEFGIDYSYYNCGGIDVFNEKPFSVAIENNKLYLKNADGTANLSQSVGEVTNDGSFEVTFKGAQKVKSISQQYYDSTCQHVQTHYTEVPLQIKLKYSVKKVSAGLYSFKRELEYESLFSEMVNDLYCQNRKVYRVLKANTSATIEAQLQRISQ